MDSNESLGNLKLGGRGALGFRDRMLMSWEMGTNIFICIRGWYTILY